MLCPACGKEQVRAPECRSCGVVFSRYFSGRRLTSARRSLVRITPPPGSRPWLLAVLAGALLVMAMLRPDSEDGATPPDEADAVADLDLVEEPEAPTEAPGLTADQITWGLELDNWQAPGYSAPAAPEAPAEPAPEPTIDESVAPPPPDEADAAAEALPPGGQSPIRHEPAAVAVAPPRGETSAPYGDDGSSPNELFDPVGGRGWYEGIDGYERALDERDRRDRTMVVYFHASWCAWCSRFRREYLSHRDMRAFLDDTIRVHIDPEQGLAEAELATLYGVRGFPSFYVIPAGTERPERLHPFLGDVELSPEEFVRLCRHVSRGLIYDEPSVLGGRGVLPFTFDG